MSNPFALESLAPTWVKATEILKAGDVQGHEFHGNQYSQSTGGAGNQVPAPRQVDPNRWGTPPTARPVSPDYPSQSKGGSQSPNPMRGNQFTPLTHDPRQINPDDFPNPLKDGRSGSQGGNEFHATSGEGHPYQAPEHPEGGEHSQGNGWPPLRPQGSTPTGGWPTAGHKPEINPDAPSPKSGEMHWPTGNGTGKTDFGHSPDTIYHQSGTSPSRVGVIPNPRPSIGTKLGMPRGDEYHATPGSIHRNSYYDQQ